MKLEELFLACSNMESTDVFDIYVHNGEYYDVKSYIDYYDIPYKYRQAQVFSFSIGPINKIILKDKM